MQKTKMAGVSTLSAITIALACLASVCCGQETAVNVYTKATMPSPGAAGRMILIQDDNTRGLWVDHGVEWSEVSAEVINVRDFGADGTDEDDDTEAINDAQAAASTGSLKAIVVFPPGIYYVSSLAYTGGVVRWYGTGVSDTQMGDAVVIRAIEEQGQGQGDNGHLLKTAGLRYVTLENMTLDANGVKGSTLILDGQSATGCVLENVRMTGAELNTLHIAPTSAVQVDVSQFRNCIFDSSEATVNAQVKVTSDNALLLQFYGCTFGGSHDYGFDVSAGQVTAFDCVMTGADAADFYLTASGYARVYGGHSESPASAKVLYAPSSGASHNGVGNMMQGFNDASTRTTSIDYATGRPLVLIGNAFAGDVNLTSPAEAYVMGNTFKFTTRKFIGNGAIVGFHSSSDSFFGSGLGNAPYARSITLVREVLSGSPGQDALINFRNEAGNRVFNMAVRNMAANSTDFDLVFDYYDGSTWQLAGYIDRTDGALRWNKPIAIGNGDPIARFVASNTTWNPPDIAHGEAASITVAVNDAAVGDMVTVGFSQAVPAGAILSGSVTSANTVTVTLLNMTGASLDLGSGILNAGAWRR